MDNEFSSISYSDIFHQIEYISPVNGEVLSYEWPVSKTVDSSYYYKILQKFLSWCSKEFPFIQTCFDAYNALSTDSIKYSDILDISHQFNEAVKRDHLCDTSINVSSKFKTRKANSQLLEYIISDCYRKAVKNPKKLNKYTAFSPEVYGEASFESIELILSELNLQDDIHFIDLGSGVGQVVLQVAGSLECKSCCGIEKVEVPYNYSIHLSQEFKRMMDWFGKPYSPFVIIKGDFMDPCFSDLVNNSNFVFANNLTFGPQLNHGLKIKFFDVKDGCRIVSTYPFCQLNFRVSARTLNDLGAMTHIKELKLKCSDVVSWTCKPLSFYLHVIDHALFQNRLSSIMGPNSLEKKKARSKNGGGGDPEITTNAKDKATTPKFIPNADDDNTSTTTTSENTSNIMNSGLVQQRNSLSSISLDNQHSPIMPPPRFNSAKARKKAPVKVKAYTNKTSGGSVNKATLSSYTNSLATKRCKKENEQVSKFESQNQLTRDYHPEYREETTLGSSSSIANHVDVVTDHYPDSSLLSTDELVGGFSRRDLEMRRQQLTCSYEVQSTAAADAPTTCDNHESSSIQTNQTVGATAVFPTSSSFVEPISTRPSEEEGHFLQNSTFEMPSSTAAAAHYHHQPKESRNSPRAYRSDPFLRSNLEVSGNSDSHHLGANSFDRRMQCHDCREKQSCACSRLIDHDYEKSLCLIHTSVALNSSNNSVAPSVHTLEKPPIGSTQLLHPTGGGGGQCHPSEEFKHIVDQNHTQLTEETLHSLLPSQLSNDPHSECVLASLQQRAKVKDVPCHHPSASCHSDLPQNVATTSYYKAKEFNSKCSSYCRRSSKVSGGGVDSLDGNHAHPPCFQHIISREIHAKFDEMNAFFDKAYSTITSLNELTSHGDNSSYSDSSIFIARTYCFIKEQMEILRQYVSRNMLGQSTFIPSREREVGYQKLPFEEVVSPASRERRPVVVVEGGGDGIGPKSYASSVDNLEENLSADRHTQQLASHEELRTTSSVETPLNTSEPKPTGVDYQKHSQLT